MREPSDSLLHAINTLDYELSKVEFDGGFDGRNEYALFGSANLVVRGIIDREPGDVDVLVTKRAWGALLARPSWQWRTPNAGDPPILETVIMGKPIHLFFAWRDDHIDIDIQGDLRHATQVWWPALGINVRCCTVEAVVAHKRQALAWPRDEWAANGLIGKMQRHQADVDAAMLAMQTSGYA